MFLRKMILTLINYLTVEEQHKGVLRLVPFVLLGITVLMSSVLFGYSLVRVVADTKTCLTIIELLALSMLSLFFGHIVDTSLLKRKLGKTNVK